jgi:hypothetical protein
MAETKTNISRILRKSCPNVVRKKSGKNCFVLVSGIKNQEEAGRAEELAASILVFDLRV